MSPVAQRMPGWEPKDEENSPGKSRHPIDEAIRGDADPDAAMVGRLLLKLSQWNEHEGYAPHPRPGGNPGANGWFL